MGINLNKQDFVFTDSSKNTKFSLDRRMAHILFEEDGEFTVEKTILDGSVDYVNRQQEIIVLENELINNEDYLVVPNFVISGGISDTEDRIISGGASIILRILRKQSDSRFLGSTVLSTIVENNRIKLVVDHNLDRTEEVNFKTVIGDDSVTVKYKIYYGRFR